MIKKEYYQHPCTWKLFCDLFRCLWFYSDKIIKLLGIVFMTLAFEGSSGGLNTILHNHKFYIAIALFLLSFLLTKILKVKSVSELEKELFIVKTLYLRDVFKRIQSEIIRKLEKEDPVDFSDYWHDLLAVIGKIYGFTNHERISIFAFSEKLNDKVIMLGRYSKNREFNRKGRGYHSTKQGSIAKALASSEDFHFKDNFPKNQIKYEKELLEKEKMTQEEINRLRMKARTIGSFVLHDKNEQDQIAVLVLESVDHKSKILTKDIANNIYSEFKKTLEEMVIFQEKLELIPELGIEQNLENE